MKTTEKLKISIITVCKNSAHYIEETIKSVLDQTYDAIEYIVIDGQSTDGTLSIIKKYSYGISYWTTEEDEGMYEAINKGLKYSTGDYILVLNSDDFLVDKNTIQKVVEEIAKERRAYYYGDIIKKKNDRIKKVKLFSVSFYQLLLSTHCTFVPHPCFFISRELNNRLQGYNTAFKYAADYDYILNALLLGSNGKYIPLYVTVFRMHENSITASGKIDNERKSILHKHGYFKKPLITRSFFFLILWGYYKIINICQKFQQDHS